MTNNNSPEKASALMYMIIAIIVAWAAIYSVNHLAKIYYIGDETYHVSMAILLVFLLIFFLYMVYQGLIAESLIALTTMIAIGSYSVVFLLIGYVPVFVFDPVVIMTGMIPIIVIGLEKRRFLLAVGCLLMVLGCCVNTNEADDSMFIIKATLLFIAAVLFGVCSGYKMYITLRNTEGTTTGRALNATAMCETVGYVALGVAMMYSIAVTNKYFEIDVVLSMVVLTMAVTIALIIAVYSAVNGSISSGATIITLSAFILLICATTVRTEYRLPPIICMILAIPLLFTAYRFHRKGDRLLTVFAILSIVCIVTRSFQQYNDSFEYGVFTSILFLADALLIEYAAFSRILFVEKNRKILPLFDGGSFVNEEEPWNRRFLPRPKDSNNSLALQTYLLVSIGLMLFGALMLDSYFMVFYTNKYMIFGTMIIIASLIILFSMENVIQGRLTETIGAISIGVLFISYSVCGVSSYDHMTYQDLILSSCLVLCGILFFLHKEYCMCVSFLCASAGMITWILLRDIDLYIVVGILLLVAGSIIMVRYNYVKLITKPTNPTITERGRVKDDVTLGRLARTLGVFLLGLILILVAFGGDEDSKCVVTMILLSGIATVVSVYGLMKDDAPGFTLLFGTSLLLFVLSICYVFTNNVSFNIIVGIFACITIPVILVYLKRKKYVHVAIGLLLFIGLILRAMTDLIVFCNTIFFITGFLMCLLALYNWLVHEDLMKPLVDPKVFGYPVRGK